MTIEFPCPQCQQLVRTPDAAAGKKGKCPSCAAVVRIPVSSAEAVEPAKPNPPAKPIAPKRPAAAQSAPPEPARAPAPASPAENTGPIEFFCSFCGQVVRTPRAAAGKKGKCPHCANIVMIPLANKPKPAAATRAPAATSPAPVAKRPTASPPKPTEDIGLAPLDDLAPLPDPVPAPVARPQPVAPAPTWQQPAVQPTPGLTPLQSPSPLTPLGSLTPLSPLTPLGGPSGDLFGGAPAGGFANDPFAGAGLGGGFGAPAAAPYGANSSYSLPPAAPSAYQAPRSAGPYDPGASLILPAIFQLIVSVPWTLLTIASVLWIIFKLILVFTVVSSSGAELNSRGTAAVGLWAVQIVVGIIAIIVQCTVVMGSIKQLQRREYDQVLTASWLSLIVCFLPFSFPWGIWSLILLHQDQVKRSFRR